jgi:hypothetical protein
LQWRNTWRFLSQLDSDRLYRWVSAGLGLILVIAGILKGHQVLTEPLAEADLVTSRWFLTVVVEFEVMFGLWLLAGLWPVKTRRLAIFWFAILSAITLYQILQGKPTCPRCFGAVPVSASAVLGLDLAAVALLWWFKPDGRFAPSIDSQRLRLALVLCVYLAIGIPAAMALVRFGPTFYPLRVEPAVVDFGNVLQASQNETTVWLTNATSEPIEVAELRTSCPCLDIDFSPRMIAPGERRAASVLLDLNRELRFAGDVEIQVQGIAATRRIAFALVVRANVRAAD